MVVPTNVSVPPLALCVNQFRCVSGFLMDARVPWLASEVRFHRLLENSLSTCAVNDAGATHTNPGAAQRLKKQE